MRLLPASLGGRLILGSIAITLVASIATLYGVGSLLERFVTGQIDQRLDNKIVALASQIRVAPDGMISLDGDADGPPFDKPHHQSFWWVGGPKNSIQTHWLPAGTFKTPSDAEIDAAPLHGATKPPIADLDAPPPPDGPPVLARTLVLDGPQGVPIHVRVARRDVGGTPVTIIAAAPRKAILDPLKGALSTLGVAVLVLGMILLFAAFSLVRMSLAPLARLQREIADVRIGRRGTLSEHQPIEIRPLVVELNSLLAQNNESLTRARRHAANLAHGLKTPLATLSLQVDRLAQPQRANLQGLVASIERHVRHHLGRARAAALDGPVRAQTLLRPRLGDIGEMLQKIHADKRVMFDLQCPLDLVLACEPQDVDEMLGNLLENAFKYSDRHVGCQAREVGANVTIEIDDDGPGLAADEIERMLHPGQRLDESIPGYGFGLPIALELAELYGGDVRLEHRQPGLRVILKLPRVL